MSSPSAFSIRPAALEDLPILFDFVRALAEFEGLSHEFTATPEMLRLHLFAEPRRAEVLFACRQNVPVGFALYFLNFSTFLGKPGLHLEDLFILPEHHGRGYGHALMVQLARVAKARDCGRFEWAVLNWNEGALEFYKTLGAVSLSEWVTQRVTGEGLDALAAQPLFGEAPKPV